MRWFQLELDIKIAEPTPSKKILDELAAQQQVFETRSNEYLNRTESIKKIIKAHDNKKKINDPNYKDFEEICLDNEVMLENDFVKVDITDKNIDMCAVANIEL